MTVSLEIYRGARSRTPSTPGAIWDDGSRWGEMNVDASASDLRQEFDQHPEPAVPAV